MGIRDIILFALLFASVPLCLLRPFYGVLAWHVASFLNPDRFTFGMANHFPVAQTIAIPTLAGFVMFSPHWKNLFSRDVLLIGLLWMWFTVTTVNGIQTPAFAHFSHDTVARWQFVSKILFMSLVTLAIVNTWARFRWLLLVVCLSFGALVLKAVPFMIVTGGSFRLYGPEGTMVGDNNDMGLVLNMTLPMFFFLAKNDPDARIRKLMTFLFVATIPAILFTYSRGGLVALVVLLFAMLLTLRRRLLLIPVVLATALFVIYWTPQHWQERMDVRNDSAVLDASARSRLNAWEYCWNLALDYPLTGAGFEAFTPELFVRYAPNPADVHGPHSIYFGVLAEHGFIGLFLYLTLIASCFWQLRRIRKYGHRSGNLLAGSYAQMLQLSLLAFLTSGAFLGRAYFDYFFTIVACTMILHRLCRSEAIQAAYEEFVAVEQTA